jgi:hypothetical protein
MGRTWSSLWSGSGLAWKDTHGAALMQRPQTDPLTGKSWTTISGLQETRHPWIVFGLHLPIGVGLSLGVLSLPHLQR